MSRLYKFASSRMALLLLVAVAPLAVSATADAKPKGQGGKACSCICASDATDPVSHAPLYTGDISYTVGALEGCTQETHDCAVKDSSGHSVPGTIHSCSASPTAAKVKGFGGTVQVHPKQTGLLHPGKPGGSSTAQ